MPRTSGVVWIITSILLYSCSKIAADVARICERNDSHFVFDLTVTCPDPTHVMHIARAVWGRLDDTGVICPTTQGLTNVYCPGDPGTLDSVRALCQDENSCVLSPTVSAYGEPCTNVYKYIEVEYFCLAADELAHLSCRCVGDADGGLKTFDGTQLAILDAQKTLGARSWEGVFNPCKYKLRIITKYTQQNVRTSTVYFSVGNHPNKVYKYMRDFIIDFSGVQMRGVGVSGTVPIELTFPLSLEGGATVVELTREGDVIKLRSSTCPYALDVDVTSNAIAFTLYTESGPLSAMCGDCDGVDDEYQLRDGTDVSAMEDRLQMISDSYAL